MKKQLFLGLMLFAFIYPCEISQAKDTHFSDSVKEQATTKGKGLFTRWFSAKKKKRVVKRRDSRRFNLRQLSPRKLIQRWVRRKKK